MENPLYWSPLHHEVHNAYYHGGGAEAVLKVVQAHNCQVTLDDVQRAIAKHKKDMNEGLCGLSLPSIIINELIK